MPVKAYAVTSKTRLAAAPDIPTVDEAGPPLVIDPIEKKPLNHFLPGTSVLSFGTAGCNLTCKFCQNWDISKARDLDRI